MRGDKARIVGNIPFPYVNLAAWPVIDVAGQAFFVWFTRVSMLKASKQKNRMTVAQLTGK